VLNDVDQLVKRTELTGGGGLKADVRGDSILCVLHVCAAAAAADAFIRTAPHPAQRHPAPPSLRRRRPTLIDGAAPVTGHLPHSRPPQEITIAELSYGVITTNKIWYVSM